MLQAPRDLSTNSLSGVFRGFPPLGQENSKVVRAWAAGKGPEISKDTLERISYVLGIFKAINILLPMPGSGEFSLSPSRMIGLGGQPKASGTLSPSGTAPKRTFAFRPIS